MPNSGQRKRNRRVARVGSIEREILENLSAGDLFVGFLCSARSTKRMFRIARERAKRRYITRLAIERLVDGKYITKSGELLSISDEGRRLLDRSVVSVRRLLGAKKWDGKWRVVAFDIPDRFGQLRNQVRSILVRAGFKKLQNSVWTFPHECEQLSEFIRKDPRLIKCVLYGVLERIGDDARLRRLFGLDAFVAH